jgi:superfamily II DNA or RNA helicase
MRLRSYQEEACNKFFEAKNKGLTRMLMTLPTGTGKCLGKNTPIIMYNGHIKWVQDIVPGDFLMGPDSTPRTVLSTATGRGNLYKITPEEGTPFVTNGPHILSLMKSDGTVLNISVEDYLSNRYVYEDLSEYKLYRKGIHFPSPNSCRDAYLTGKLLISNRPIDRRLLDVEKETIKSNHSLMCSYITQFKLSSMNNRALFMVGALSNAKFVENYGYILTIVNRKLANNILWISRSLGLNAKLVTVNDINDQHDIIHIKTPDPIRVSTSLHNVVSLTGFSIESIGDGNYYGFELSDDRLFLLGDFIVTHNTVLFSHIDKKLREQGESRPTLVIAHRDELLDQAAEKFEKVSPDVSISKEKAKLRATNSNIVLASIQSIGRSGSDRLNDYDFGLIIVDECHHAQADSYKTALTRLGAFDGDRLLLGVTATPVRMDRKQLHTASGAIFEEEIYRYTMRQAMKDGWICPIRGYQVETFIDISKVSVKAGDFNEKELENIVVGSNRNDIIYENWKKICPTRKTLVFCISRAHAEEVYAFMKQKGVRVGCVFDDSKDRKAIVEDFRIGNLQMLVNVRIATEGWDVPDIGCIIQASPTLSWPLYVQEIGRGTRIYPGKTDLIVIDVVDNTSRHNLCTVPAILGLPRTLNLKGTTLATVADLVDSTGCGDLGLLAKEAPKSIEELKIILKKIELLSLAMTPEEIKQFTKYAWVPLTNGDYYLGCGLGKSAEVRFDTAGNMICIMKKDGREILHRTYDMDPEKLWPMFEEYIAKTWPDSLVLIKRNASWWKEEASVAQKKYLTSLGIDWKIWGGSISKGHASRLIDHARAMGKVPKPMSISQLRAIQYKTNRDTLLGGK